MRLDLQRIRKHLDGISVMVAITAATLLLTSCAGGVGDADSSAEIDIQKGDLITVSSGERIYVRKAGHGPKPVVLIPGNNCSGICFEPIFSFVRALDRYSDAYTFYTFDYRGSGVSTYNAKVTSLGDFARDFNDIIQQDSTLREGNITLVGYSMGFGVAQKMVDLDGSKYANIVSLAGIGTRGVRVIFAPLTDGTDPVDGVTYRIGDWSDSLSATAFQQRLWEGENRTYSKLVSVWDMAVYNDILKYDIVESCLTDLAYKAHPFYEASLIDVFSIEYMPESLHSCHFFNSTATTLTHTNSNGTIVSISGTDETGAFDGKRVLLLKAKTDRTNWRGDLIIDDSITRNTKYDLKQGGAVVTAVIIAANEGYDHGFPIHHPLETLKVIAAFVEAPGELTSVELDPIIGNEKYTIYLDAETSWEWAVHGGF